jgi:2-oxoglutarate dehydrogenase E1 component
MIEAPIFHVNGDDPEAVVFAAKVATEFRQRFHKPVVVDMFCYRRFGHNEGDEPAFTQPLMYKAVANHPTTLEIYSEKLIGEASSPPTRSSCQGEMARSPRAGIRDRRRLPPEQG